MLNEVFIAVGTMSVSPGSRWRNRLREKEPEGGGCGGAAVAPVGVRVWGSRIAGLL